MYKITYLQDKTKNRRCQEGGAGGREKNMIANIIIVMLGLGCAFLAVGLWIERLLNRPIERRWR